MICNMIRLTFFLILFIISILFLRELWRYFRRAKLLTELEDVNETIECSKVNDKIAEKTSQFLDSFDKKVKK